MGVKYRICCLKGNNLLVLSLLFTCGWNVNCAGVGEGVFTGIPYPGRTGTGVGWTGNLPVFCCCYGLKTKRFAFGKKSLLLKRKRYKIF